MTTVAAMPLTDPYLPCPPTTRPRIHTLPPSLPPPLHPPYTQSIPEMGDYTLKKQRRLERFAPVPDRWERAGVWGGGGGDG